MKNKVYANASIVTGLSVAERGLGFLYRIVLSRLIGAEGLGLYQVALSLFSLFLTIGTGGLPISVSRLTSKSKAEQDPVGEKKAVSAGILLCLFLTLPVAFALFLFGNKIPFLFSDDRTFEVFRILLIGLVFSSVYAVIRGSFWGNKEFLTPSILEISEETVMVIAGILLLQKVSSPLVGAEKAAWAVVISYLFSCTASLICFFLRGGKLSSPKGYLKPLFSATAPITAVRASGSIVNSAIAVLLPVMLIRAGLSESEAMTAFGVVSGMVLPILFIPATLIGSVSLVLVPELSEDYYRGRTERLRKNLRRGLTFSSLIACALIPFFFALGKDLGRLAYSNPTAGEMIVKSAPILLPMSLTMISTSMLNSLGYEKQSFLFYFIGAVAMLLCILFLPKYTGAYAYVIGLGVSYVLCALCNLAFLQKKGLLFSKKQDPVKQKQAEKSPSLWIALFAVLPISLFGRLCDTLFKKVMGEFFTVALTFLLLSALTLLIYLFAGFIPFVNPFKVFRLKRHSSKPPRS